MFGTWIGWIVKLFDYINRVNITLPLSVYEGTWTHSPPLVAMHSTTAGWSKRDTTIRDPSMKLCAMP